MSENNIYGENESKSRDEELNETVDSGINEQNSPMNTVDETVAETSGADVGAYKEAAHEAAPSTATDAKAENDNGCTYHTGAAQINDAVYAYKNLDNERTEASHTDAPRTEVYINRNAGAYNIGEENKKTAKEPHRRGLATIAVVAVLCVLLSGLAAFGGTYLAGRALDDGSRNEASVIYKSVSNNNDSTSIGNTDSTFGQTGSYAAVAAKVAGTIVEIRTETVSTSSIFSQYITEGAGSGVIITSDGYIITNNHVIDKASTVTVTTNDGTKYPAEVIGYDAESDLAVIKIEATGLTPAVVGDSSKLVVGEEVIAIGNPLGSLGGTVTNGIISALERQVTIDGTAMTLLQTNAAVNPGNSGGGLFNMAGELIGIVNAKSSGSGIEGLGFAIPSNMASQVVEQLINYGYVRGRVSLGITYIDISDSYTAMMYRVNTLGVYILESEYNDELKIGDRVTAVDGTEVTYGSDIKSILKDHNVGDKITLTVVRDGKYVDVEMECHEYVPGTSEADEEKTSTGGNTSGIFKSPFSGWFGY